MESSKLTGKQGIRSKYLSYRDSLTKSERIEKSKRIWSKLKQEKCFQKAEIILTYMDYRSEVMTTGLVEELFLSESGKKVYAPTVEGMDIVFYEIHSMEELSAGYQGIREPKSDKERSFTEETAKGHKCLLLVPGAVFDRELNRMGYGKGFYDRFLHKYDNIEMTKIGLAYNCQLAKQVPVEAHDKKMDLIITENEVLINSVGKEIKKNE